MRDNKEAGRFELEMEGKIVFADYQLDGTSLVINHVESPEELRGKGAAGRLMQEIGEHAQKSGLKIIPICGYAASWLRRSKEFSQLVN